MSDIRIGHGYDVHRFTEGEFITLGGVKITHNQSFIAHSDGDVLLHSLCDALLGAAALGDIGRCFPDTDDAYKDIDSRLLLQQVHDMIKNRGYTIGNIDVTIVAQAPTMKPHIELMTGTLSQDLSLDSDHINIKATTTEELGFEGRQEGIAVHAVVLIKKEK